jgi:hypothetical protein
MLVQTEVGVFADQEKAERRAARMNDLDAFPGQRYVVENGVRPGTFAVVLFDVDAKRPTNTHRAGLRDDLRERVNYRGLMRNDNAKTAIHRLLG